MTAIRKERIRTETTEPTLGEGYVVKEYAAYAWMCSGCGLVWEKKHLAEDCGQHGHQAVWIQEYPRKSVDGIVLAPTCYQRRALRKDRVLACHQTR